MKENVYLHNRRRQVLAILMQSVRDIQVVLKLKDSEVVKAMLTVYQKTDAKNMKVCLIKLVSDLERDEDTKV